MLKRIKIYINWLKVEKKINFKHASNCHRTVSPVEITSVCNSHSKTIQKKITNNEFNWLNLITGSVLISFFFFFFAKCLVFFAPFYVHSNIDCSSRFRCHNSTMPLANVMHVAYPAAIEEEKKQESDSKLVKRRQ